MKLTLDNFKPVNKYDIRSFFQVYDKLDLFQYNTFKKYVVKYIWHYIRNKLNRNGLIFNWVSLLS